MSRSGVVWAAFTALGVVGLVVTGARLYDLGVRADEGFSVEGGEGWPPFGLAVLWTSASLVALIITVGRAVTRRRLVQSGRPRELTD